MSSPDTTYRSRAKRNRSSSEFLSRYGPWGVVTGASSGIGRAIALQLAERGLNVFAVARSETNLEALQIEIGARFEVQARTLALDLGAPGCVERLADAVHDLDIGLLVAAAGFGTSGPFLQSEVSVDMDMLQVNCAAVMQQCLLFANRFAGRGGGGIVLMGSLVGFQGVPNSAHYAATKAYVQTLAEGLHLELARHGVDVLSSAPGPVRSGFEARAGMRMGAALEPDEVARETLAALGRRTTVAPGALSKLLSWSLAPLPRPVRARIMGRVMGEMTKHRIASPS